MDAERHWRKLSEEAWVLVERKKKLEMMSIARAMIRDEAIEFSGAALRTSRDEQKLSLS
jgi:hypothetical protein